MNESTRASDRLAAEAAAVLARLGGVAPSPMRTVDGAPGGVHRAARRGGGIEFAEHREYGPGDDLRHLDWRAYARNDRYYVKRFEQEAHASITLLVDTSSSMDIHSDDSGAIRSAGGSGADGGAAVDKLGAIKLLCAALAMLVVRRGDAIGLTFAGRPLDLMASGGEAHLRRVLDALAGLEAQGPTGFDGLDRRLLRGPERRGAVVAVSDLLGEPAAVLAPLAQLRRVGPQVMVLQCLHPRELDLAFDGAVQLHCGETDRRDLIDPRAMRATYSELMQAHIADVRDRAVQAGLRHQLVDLGVGTDMHLRSVFRVLGRAGRQPGGWRRRA